VLWIDLFPFGYKNVCGVQILSLSIQTWNLYFKFFYEPLILYSSSLVEMRKHTRRHRKGRRTRKQKGGQNLRISYNGTSVQGQQLTQEQTSKQPSITIPPGHTLVLYDPDAVNPSYIHWIATAKESLLPYKGPSPPPGTGIHHYKFALVKGPVQVPSSRAPVKANSLIGTPIETTEFIVDSL
jgi:phosphatidylethanolamine-binding protein (PEBP) family uncharacterized protein